MKKFCDKVKICKSNLSRMNESRGFGRSLRILCSRESFLGVFPISIFVKLEEFPQHTAYRLIEPSSMKPGPQKPPPISFLMKVRDNLGKLLA